MNNMKHSSKKAKIATPLLLLFCCCALFVSGLSSFYQPSNIFLNDDNPTDQSKQHDHANQPDGIPLCAATQFVSEPIFNDFGQDEQFQQRKQNYKFISYVSNLVCTFNDRFALQALPQQMIFCNVAVLCLLCLFHVQIILYFQRSDGKKRCNNMRRCCI